MSEEERIRKSWSDKLDRLEAGDFSDWFKDTTQVLVGLDRERTICNTKIPPNVTSVFKYDGEKWVLESMTGHVTTWKSRTGCISEAFAHGMESAPEVVSAWDPRTWIVPEKSVNFTEADFERSMRDANPDWDAPQIPKRIDKIAKY